MLILKAKKESEIEITIGGKKITILICDFPTTKTVKLGFIDKERNFEIYRVREKDV